MLSAQPISPRTRSRGCGTAGPRGPPLCPSSRRPPPAPHRSAEPLRRPPDPGNSQMGRYHPRAAGGGVRGGLAGPIPEAPATGRFTGDSRQGAGGGGGGGRGSPESERPAAAAPYPPPRAARWFAPRRALGRQVRLRARAGEALGEQQAAWGWPVCPQALPLRSCAHPVRTLFWRGLRHLFSSLPKGRREETPKFSALPKGLSSQPTQTWHCTHISQLNN